MNVEQRLVNALRAADRVEPSPDLWSRVVHSIEEDRAHRRRVVTSSAVTIAVMAGLVVVGMLNMIDTPSGRQVRVPAMELIETIALVSLVAVLGPAIRRFGRGYADDLWPTTPTMPSSLLRLLDVAYLLVFGGYILLTTYFDFGRSTIGVAATGRRVVPTCRRPRADDGTAARRHDHGRCPWSRSSRTRPGSDGALPRWLVIVLVLVGGLLGLFALWATHRSQRRGHPVTATRSVSYSRVRPRGPR